MEKYFTRHLLRFLFTAVSLLSALSLNAAYTLKVSTLCDDAIYSVNERVRFVVTLTGSGSSVVPASVDASWKISKDGVAPIFTGTVRLENGVGEFIGSLDEPGFLYAEVTFTPSGGGAITAVAGAGIAPEQIAPSMEMPSDFVSFWQAQKAALAQIPMNITYTPTSDSTESVEVLDVKADSIDGVPVSGYLVKPKGARPGSRPAILTLHGAGVSSASASATWVNEGFISLNINAHGILNGQPAEYYTDLRDGALSGYALFGRDSRETSYFRGMFMRLVRAIDILAQQPEWDGKTLITYGTSQGGAQAIAAAGLDERVSFVAAGVTAMADHTGMVANRVAGWPKWVTVTGDTPNANRLEASRYYDVVNFAQLIERDGTFTVGFIDRTTPPSTVYAMYNAWGGENKTMFNDIHTGHANTAPALASMRESILAHLAEQNTGIIFVRGSATEVDLGGHLDLTIRVGTGISSVTVSNGVGTLPVDAEGYATVRVYPQGSTSYMVTAQDSDGTLYTTQFEVTQNPLIPLLIRSSAVQGNNYVIEFSGKPETTYAVKGSLNLETFNDDFGTVTTNTQGIGNVQIPINPSETKRYFRIEVIDANNAYFSAPQFLGSPDAHRAVDNRAITMAPSMAVAPNGRLWATWYAGITPGEDSNNYVVLATSGDNGENWEEVLVADPDGSGPVRAFDPEIWMAPDGNVYWIWAQGQRVRDSGIAPVRWETETWALKIETPENGAPRYGEPVRWAEGVMMCKPIVLLTGEWVLPVSLWRQVEDSAQMVVSIDQGKNWHVRGAVNVPQDARSFDEHMIVERKDGSLWMLVRTRYGIGESISADRGKTWSELTPSSIPHVSARFFIYRLVSGNLLLVRHAADPATGRISRTHITAYISTDDGQSWSGGLLLDERGSISYPDGQQGPDGTIYITYDRSRTGAREILFAVFTEADVLAANPEAEGVRLQQLVSKGFVGQNNPELRDNADGVAFQSSAAGAFDTSGYAVVPLEANALWFSDRQYVANSVPAELAGLSFVQVAITGNKNLTCTREGMVYFLTPAADRNTDSQAAILQQQGFKKVAMREYMIFSASLANACTLYQKYCTEGEIINFGKWAVPLMYP